jgi:hypothetical protein
VDGAACHENFKSETVESFGLDNKKGRGETAPTFLLIILNPCRYIRGQQL